MKPNEIREKYLKFFEERGHRRIDPASLVPVDGTTLFTTAGMQPLVPYLLGKEHPQGKRLVDIQPCFRTDDIEDVGDNSHNTFLEMMGNWSLGDYWKEESLKWSLEFLTQELNLPKEKLAVTVFEGDIDAPRDEESINIWKNLGITEERIFPLPKKDNWWGPVGGTGPCGPDSEIFYWTGVGEPKDSPETNALWVEVWNNVFMQYNKMSDGTFELLRQKNVDTGMGLERTTTVVQGKKSVYETDFFVSPRLVLGDIDERVARIILDHIRAAIFLVDAGVFPSNKTQGYVLRRLIRRAAVYSNIAGLDLGTVLPKLAQEFVKVYDGYYLDGDISSVIYVINAELNKFFVTLDRGLREVAKVKEITGKQAFDFYQTYGFPLELTEELFRQKGQEINKDEFFIEFEKHKELSRTASVGMFKGGLTSTGAQETKYHTATHLIHAALRRVLGDHVLQRGSNITTERMRFDFLHTEKVTTEQLKKVEEMVNEQIKKGIEVICEEMTREEAERSGAIGVFDQKYSDKVKIYSIGDFSKEFCGGPHVANTLEIGHVTIVREESASAGTRRIYATVN